MRTQKNPSTNVSSSVKGRRDSARRKAVGKDRVVIAAFAGVIGLWASWGTFLGLKLTHWWGADNSIQEDAGQFGDMFGGLNALFTALAFAAVWWTGRMQQREMQMQRRELRLQRKALRLQREELADTRTVMTRQTFESMFFQMLRLSREIRDVMQAPADQVGASAVRHYAKECRTTIEGHGNEPNDDELRRLIGLNYEMFIYDGEAEPYVGPYFRSLFHVFKLINETRFRSDVKARYASIARAQLSADDLVLLAANACSDVGSGFRQYIEKFGLLKHYPGEPSRSIIERCFEHTAFPGD